MIEIQGRPLPAQLALQVTGRVAEVFVHAQVGEEGAEPAALQSESDQRLLGGIDALSPCAVERQIELIALQRERLQLHASGMPGGGGGERPQGKSVDGKPIDDEVDQRQRLRVDGRLRQQGLRGRPFGLAAQSLEVEARESQSQPILFPVERNVNGAVSLVTAVNADPARAGPVDLDSGVVQFEVVQPKPVDPHGELFEGRQKAPVVAGAQEAGQVELRQRPTDIHVGCLGSLRGLPAQHDVGAREGEPVIALEHEIGREQETQSRLDGNPGLSGEIGHDLHRARLLRCFSKWRRKVDSGPL